jgi:hypothetical protein
MPTTSRPTTRKLTILVPVTIETTGELYCGRCCSELTYDTQPGKFGCRLFKISLADGVHGPVRCLSCQHAPVGRQL